MDWHATSRGIHIAAGFGGFGLGLAALLLPKFGVRAVWHRLVGRAYAVCMLVMAVLSVPLAIRLGSVVLLVVGIATIGFVVGGWLMIRSIRKPGLDPATRRLRIGRHLALMGSSYVGAWTAFLLNNPIFGAGPTQWWVYTFGPTVIGVALIVPTVRRYQRAGCHPIERPPVATDPAA